MKIAFLTSGGNAPCLSSSIGRLLYNYNKLDDKIEAYSYINGFAGLLMGNKISLPMDLANTDYENFYKMGGSIIGNSRVKLTNKQDCIQKKLIDKDQDPLEVASEQLIKDKIDILHPIGGDDTNSTARDLVNYINSRGVDITLVGIPKTIDNDIYPVKQSLGASSAAESGAIFFNNIVNENNMSPRQLIIHEVMGRNSGWLTAYTAKIYSDMLDRKKNSLENLNLGSIYNLNRFKIHALYVPEESYDFTVELERLNQTMNDIGCLNVFISEGAFLKEISNEIESKGNEINRDAFGHIQLDSINTGKWISKIISDKINIERVLIQKSGYFARSSAPNSEDLEYIFKICDFAFKQALNGNSGVAGVDERTNELSCIDFNLIRGDKGLDINSKWYLDMMKEIRA